MSKAQIIIGKDVQERIKAQISTEVRFQHEVSSEIELERKFTNEKTERKQFEFKQIFSSSKLSESCFEPSINEILKKVQANELSDKKNIEVLFTELENLKTQWKHSEGLEKILTENDKQHLQKIFKILITRENSQASSELKHKHAERFQMHGNTIVENIKNVESNLTKKLSSKLLVLYSKLYTDDQAKTKFESKIQNDKYRKLTYEKLQELKAKNFDWTECFADDDIFDEFFENLLKICSFSSLNFYLNDLKTLSKSVQIQIVETLLVEKFKSAVMDEVVEKVNQKAAEKSIALSNSEMASFLKPWTNQENSALKVFHDLSDNCFKEKKKTLTKIIETILESETVEDKILDESFNFFMMEKSKTNSEENMKIIENVNLLYRKFSQEKSTSSTSIMSKTKKLFSEKKEDKDDLEKEKYFPLNLIQTILSNKEIKKSFKSFFIESPAASRVVLNILAKLFDVEVIVYKKIEESLHFVYVFHSLHKTSQKLRILLSPDEKTYSMLEENETKLNLHKQRLTKDSIFSNTIDELKTLNTKEEVDYYIAKRDFLKKSTKALDDFEISDSQVVDNITQFYSDSEENQKNFKTSVSDFQKICNDSSIMRLILIHFSNNGCWLPQEEFVEILNVVISYRLSSGKSFDNIFKWIFLTKSQRSWLPALILMRVEDAINEVDDKWKLETVQKLSDVDNRNLLLVMSDKLDEGNLFLNRNTFDEIVNNLEIFTLDTLDFLEEVSLLSWTFIITEMYWKVRIMKLLGIENEKDEKICLISYHFISLQLQYKVGLLKEFFEVFDAKGNELNADKLLKILIVFTMNEVSLNQENIHKFKNSKLDGWIQWHSLKSNSTQRSVKAVIKIIKHNLPAEIAKITKPFLKEIENEMKNFDIMKTKMSSKLISKFNRSDIETWREDEFNKSSTNPLEVLRVIVRGFEICAGSPLHNNLIISILLFWKTKNHLFLAIGTGEGKSWLTLGFSIMKVLYGETVDVITSSNLLAVRDAQLKVFNDVYDVFGVTYGHNCHENLQKRQEVYSTKNVVYGSLMNFQRDYLLDTFYGKKLSSGRKRENVLIDEVDNMLFDKGLCEI